MKYLARVKTVLHMMSHCERINTVSYYITHTQKKREIHTLSLKISSAAKRMSPLALPLFVTGYQSSFGVMSSSGINLTMGEQTLLPRNSSLPCNKK